MSLAGPTPTEIPIFRGTTQIHTVLVVDDASTIRQHARAQLEHEGFEVLEAANGREGLEVALKHRVDAIIVDVNMPVMNGIEMVGAIRRLAEYRKTPIFVLSTESSPASVLEGKAVGATAWMVKPFRGEVLIPALRRVLKR
jgi:two-component system, chemotaxis family, chemotaxis protein CheY